MGNFTGQQNKRLNPYGAFAEVSYGCSKTREKNYLCHMKTEILRLFGRKWILAILGGLLLAVPWTLACPITLPLALLPWFMLWERLLEDRVSYKKSYLYLYLSTIVWNFASVWWIAGATVGGMLGAVFVMAALMALMLLLPLWAWRVKGWGTAFLVFMATWLAFEYFFHNSEIAWPWLTLGNSLGTVTPIVQWYEYTGVLGGSLWIILANGALFAVLRAFRVLNFAACKASPAEVGGGNDARQVRKATVSVRSKIFLFLLWGLVLFTPMVLSAILLATYHDQKGVAQLDVVAIQPRIDPWNEKFEGMSAVGQAELMVHLADSATTSATQMVVSPETSLPVPMWLTEIMADSQVQPLREFLSRHPGCQWITGADALRYYPEGEVPPPTARSFSQASGSYDAYNVALLLDTSDAYQMYIKSKLVVGVEMLPYPKYLKLLNSLSINLGGITGTLGSATERTVFPLHAGGSVAPVICYESAFGEFCTEYVRKGANALVVITNDAWWGNTPGYRQLLTYSQLRCIELRRWMVRSANTGISAIITPTGRIINRLGWWKRGALRGNISLQSRLTFYALHGDYLGRLATGISILLLLYLAIQTIVGRKAWGRRLDV